MEAVSITLTILSLCLTALSITFVILNFGRGKGKDGLQNEARLVSIEKDVQYIRMKVDGLHPNDLGYYKGYIPSIIGTMKSGGTIK